MKLFHHITSALFDTGKVVVAIFCLIVFLTEPLCADGAQDETPYNPPIPRSAPQPFNAINNPGTSTQQTLRPRAPNNTGRTVPVPSKLNTPGNTPAPAQPPVAPPAPQVVTGTGRNFGNITLRVDPLMIRAKEGDIIQQDIILDNPRGITIDEAEIVLKFSTKNLEVLDSNPTLSGINIKPVITPQKNPDLQIVLNQVDTTKGQIHFIVKSLSNNSYMGGKLATISWKAKKASFYTPITFVFPSDFKSPGTKVRRQGRDLLGADSGGSEGVITGGIAITPKPIPKTTSELQ